MTWYVFGPVGIKLSTVFVIYSAVTCLLFRDNEMVYFCLQKGTLAWLWLMSFISSIGGYTIEEKAVGIAMVVIISVVVIIQWVLYVKKISTASLNDGIEIRSSSRYVTDAFASVESNKTDADSDIL